VTGDVYFGRNVTLRGTVIVVANEGQRIDIPDGCILENRLLSGNLTMTVRAYVSTARFTNGDWTHEPFFPGLVIGCGSHLTRHFRFLLLSVFSTPHCYSILGTFSDMIPLESSAFWYPHAYTSIRTLIFFPPAFRCNCLCF
jgi:hypothetical protein